MGPELSRKGKEREAGRFVDEMRGVFKETEAALKQAAEDMKRFYDHRLGPFEIISKHGPMVYKLRLPKMYKVHPIFPAIKLTKAKDNEWEQPIPRVTLKVWDPAAGEFVRTTEWEQVEGI